jgi:glycerol-3-phosphate dehydrogenase
MATEPSKLGKDERAKALRALGFNQESDSLKESGSSIRAAHVRDTLTGETFTIHAKHIINAADV